MPSTVTVSTPAPGAGIEIVPLAAWFVVKVPRVDPPYVTVMVPSPGAGMSIVSGVA